MEDIDPARHPAPRLEARTLKTWLDEGCPVTLLDTPQRLRSEDGDVSRRRGSRHRKLPRLSGGRGAAARGMEGSAGRDFLHRRHPAARRPRPTCSRPVSSRSSNSTGGILKYFEECGAAHYEGECFVFDRRSESIRAAGDKLRDVLRLPDAAHRDGTNNTPHYVPDKSCPYCFTPEAPETPIRLNH